METDIRKVRTCERCKVQVPLANVRLYARDAEHNMLLCEPCCDTFKKKKLEFSFNSQKTVVRNVYQPKEMIRNQPAIKITEPKLEASKVINRPMMKCSRCDYTFTMAEQKSGSLPTLSCPYCSKADRLQRVTHI